MKIAIVGSGFSGATLPLAKELSVKGNQVDCYYFVENNSYSMESIDFDDEKLRLFNIDKLSLKNELYNYLDKAVGVYLFPYIKRRHRLEKIGVGLLIKLADDLFSYRLAKTILNKKYDIVNIVIHCSNDLSLYHRLRGRVNIVFSLHEILKNHSSNNPEIKEEAKIAINSGCPIIVHSVKSYNDLLNTSNVNKNLLNMIHFGSFDSFLAYKNKSISLILPKKYLLYIGYIFPHKGLPLLYESTIKALQKVSDIKVVIAGMGYVPILEKMNEDAHFVVHNRYIDNIEFVKLLQGCKAVICPYLSASQSGIVQTAAVFNKPVIATNVGAFSETIIDGKNGALVNLGDSYKMSEAMINYWNSEIEINEVLLNKKYKWSLIADQYINLFNKYNLKNVKTI